MRPEFSRIDLLQSKGIVQAISSETAIETEGVYHKVLEHRPISNVKKGLEDVFRPITQKFLAI